MWITGTNSPNSMPLLSRIDNFQKDPVLPAISAENFIGRLKKMLMSQIL
jgi:hypothetical protein